MAIPRVKDTDRRGTATDNHRILVIDDSESIRDVLRTLLVAEGCDVRVAESAEDGLVLMMEVRPAVIVVDVVLPGMSGLDLLSDIRERFAGTEVLVISSHASAEKARRALQEGAYGYLEKPFDQIGDVWITVQKGLERRRLAEKEPRG